MNVMDAIKDGKSMILIEECEACEMERKEIECVFRYGLFVCL